MDRHTHARMHGWMDERACVAEDGLESEKNLLFFSV